MENRPVSPFFLLVSIFLLTASSLLAQTEAEKLLSIYSWRNIGPANPGGRISDVEAVESNPKIIYAGAASGGVWKSENAGITWTAVFDDQPVGSIGDIAIAQKDPNIVYVGTGEPNSRNSSPWGGGVFKTTDGGKNWEFLGLKETHHIGRIVIDPKNPDVVYVAAAGHLWGPNEERGLFKTGDGGKTWDKVLYIDERTGVIDVAMDPKNNKIIYAAAYERRRDAFSGGNPEVRYGPGAGIYVSRNSGKTWTKITKGLPTVELGRIGLAVARSDPGTVYAIIETRSSGGGRGGRGGGRGGRGSQPEQLDPNRGGIFKSTDEGKSWKQTGSYNSRPFYYSQIRVDPNDENTLWVGGGLMYSEDSGKTFESRRGSTMVDFHAIWIDPNDSDHIISGCDGGLNISFDRGKNWDIINQMPIAQFYAITADMQKPYYVYGGLQDVDSWAGPSRTRSRWGIRNRDWFSINGGDGLQAQVDPTDHTIVFTERQGGNLSRLDLKTGKNVNIRPNPQNIVNFKQYYPNYQTPSPGAGRGGGRGGGGNNPLRFDWNSPIKISKHNPRTLYFGGNHLFKSLDRGDNWSIVSNDLTSTPDKPSAIVSIGESGINPSVIWAGTNDGNVWLTRNGGMSWRQMNYAISNAPANYWVKRIEASSHVESRAYVVFDGHRNDDQEPYVYVTEDFGKTWNKISNNLPEGSVYVVREDYKNPNLLFAGTEFSIFASLDRGKTWNKFTNNFPAVPVHDLYIHPREGDLIAGTHGRGAWIADNITALQQLTGEILEEDSHLFDVRTEIKYASMIEWAFSDDKTFRAPNPPEGSTINYYLKTKPKRAELEITDVTGEKRFSTAFMDEETGPGLHSFIWNFQFNQPPFDDEQRSQFEDRIQTAIDDEESEEKKAEIQGLLDKF
ncbi:hypothetical protein IID62_09825, partial [candidate division KSB1 bacterium]|nr:hypothetical protein [candidate division KSB1 bacterium]